MSYIHPAELQQSEKQRIESLQRELKTCYALLSAVLETYDGKAVKVSDFNHHRNRPDISKIVWERDAIACEMVVKLVGEK